MSGAIRKTKIDPFGTTSIENYEYLYEEFGIQPLRPAVQGEEEDVVQTPPLIVTSLFRPVSSSILCFLRCGENTPHQ